jgi:hypothetical protein
MRAPLNVLIFHPHKPAKRTNPLNTVIVIGNLLKTFILSRTRTLLGKERGGARSMLALLSDLPVFQLVGFVEEMQMYLGHIEEAKARGDR